MLEDFPLYQFLKEEVEDYVECHDLKITKEQKKNIIEELFYDQNMYDYLTDSIHTQLQRIGVE